MQSNLKIEVLGMNADDLDVRVTKEAVTIAGERKYESKSEQNGMKRLCPKGFFTSHS